MDSHDENDDAWVHHRLPVRRVEARPDVLARLRGEAAGTDDANTAATAPADGGFPWARTAVSKESLADGATDGGDDADSVSRDDTDDDADLTDWQRQWLDLSAPEDEPDESIPSVDAGGWWEGIPAVRQLLLDGVDLGAATVFVGENGSGKSTIVEALAMAYGLAPEGGSVASRHRTRVTESGLGEQLALVRNAGASRRGYFLRAETMHAFFSYLEDNPGSDPNEPLFHELSHGESFVALVEVKMKPNWPGLLVLDEPESALSFDNQLRLLRHLQALMATGRHQVVMATHSPILAALPGATLYEVDARGFHEVDHDDATLVRNWRHFMNDPSAYLD